MVAGTNAKQRLIDANAYLNKVCTYNKTGCGSCKLQTVCPADEPTIDAEPVRHVKNIGTDYNEVDQFICSECGIELQDWRRVERDDYDGEETYHEYRLRYCPNCGGRIVEE